MPKANTGYVVYGCEHLRDGLEEWAKCFDTLETALAYVNEDFFANGRMTFRLFELGKEVKLEERVEEIPQPPRMTKRLVAKRG